MLESSSRHTRSTTASSQVAEGPHFSSPGGQRADTAAPPHPCQVRTAAGTLLDTSTPHYSCCASGSWKSRRLQLSVCLARCTTRGSTNTNNVGHQAALVPREANQRHCRTARLSLCLVAAAPVRWPRQLQIRRPQVVRRIFQPQSQDYHYLLYPLSRGYSQALFYFHEPATTRASLNQQFLRRAPHRAISHHHPRDSHHPYTKPPATICRRQTQTLRVKEGCPP
jgi:hypothetical protein